MAAILGLAAFRPALDNYEEPMLICFYFFSGSSFCFLINDLFDRKKDIVNNKNRPIATGKLSVSNTIIALALFSICFLIIGYLLNEIMSVLAMIAMVSFYFYSPINSKTGLLANAIVAFWAVAPMWEAFIIQQNGYDLIWFSIGFFVMVIIREVLLDWLDVDGDKAVGKPSLPIILSEKYLKITLTMLMVLGSILLMSVYWFASISKVTYILLMVSVILSWFPYVRLLQNSDRRTVLFNVRFSHLSFGVFTIALFLR